jgi:hypothetical protein
MPNSAGNDTEDRMIAAASHVFAAAGRASRSPRTPRSLSVRISEDESAFFETSNPLLASNPLSGASSASRSVAYRPVTPEQMRAAILLARPHTLTSSQRMLQLPDKLESTSDGIKFKNPFKRIVVGRSMTMPLLQVRVLTTFAEMVLHCCLLMSLSRLVVSVAAIVMTMIFQKPPRPRTRLWKCLQPLMPITFAAITLILLITERPCAPMKRRSTGQKAETFISALFII